MPYKKLQLLAVLALGTFANAAPHPEPTYTPPPFGKTYLTGYPICHIVGYNVEPSNCNWVNFADSGLSLSQCSAACQTYKVFDCLSYAWGYKNGGCVLYSGRVEDCQNYAEGISKYAVYDVVCSTS